MVAEKIKVIEVNNYDELFEMYKNGELGSVEQRLPNNLIRLKAGQDGDDEELINSLLSMDTDNLYHVEFIDTRDRYFRITILGFTVKKFLNDKVSAIEITFGEDGIWEEALLDDEFYHDASPFGDLEIHGIDVPFIHEFKN